MIGHEYRPNKKISLIGLTHTLELRVALTHNNKKKFVFNLTTANYLLSQLQIHLVLTLLLNLLIKMIFSVQNSNLMFAVEFSPDLVQFQVRETVSGVFLAQMDIHIHVWNKVEVMRRDFNDYHITQVPMIENQLGEMQMMKGWRKWLSMWE